MKHIAIFASGKGSNAQAIIQYFKNHPTVKVALVLTNNPSAGVIAVAHEHKIISAIVNTATLKNEQTVSKLLDALKIDFIVLAGFMQMIPEFLVKKFSGRIVNIHPALLPKYGGKGMYGIKVHETVLKNNETETGITIHYVNERYDDGEIILQKTIRVEPNINAEKLAAQVQALEHEWYPKTIEQLLK
ncbi:MAG: phosphoribosylglycinamide formyltransferase [Chitinophagales bacterium]|nr:phosphoribosylglycinamide formyltransferase [Chitinophagales bacterium]